MWVNKGLYQVVLDDNRRQQEQNAKMRETAAVYLQSAQELRSQKAKDDITIDWMRHRINALEKQNAILMQKAAGIAFPVPEIVPTRPGSMSPDYTEMPSFEDVGDVEAARLGIKHDETGKLEYTK